MRLGLLVGRSDEVGVYSIELLASMSCLLHEEEEVVDYGGMKQKRGERGEDTSYSTRVGCSHHERSPITNR